VVKLGDDDVVFRGDGVFRSQVSELQNITEYVGYLQLCKTQTPVLWPYPLLLILKLVTIQEVLSSLLRLSHVGLLASAASSLSGCLLDTPAMLGVVK
jgi:hypothetical protein